MRVGLVFGGRSVEHVVSVRSARTVKRGLESAGHEVVCLGIADNGAWLAPSDAKKIFDADDKALPRSSDTPQQSLRHLVDARVDAVFPIVHGTYGEDGTLQGLFEMLDIPYVGCGVLSSSVAMDKLQSKRVFGAAGLPMVPYAAVSRAAFEQDAERALSSSASLPLPLFVKPSVGGSSVGVKKVKARSELKEAVEFALRFDDTALIEQGVVAREVEVAVLGGAGALSASVPGEIVPGGEFYDYEDKYLKDAAKLLAPAPVDESTKQTLQALAMRALDAIGGSGMARVDFFLLKDPSSSGAPKHGVFLNEINTLPGFTDVSMYPRLWGLSGVPLDKLCDRLVQIAVQRHKDKARLDQSLRAFVQSVA